MKKQSIWTNNQNPKSHNSLKKDINTDILIIGGGIAGLSCAYFLKDTNYKITLIEKDNCGFGITSHSSAKITYAQEAIYHTLPQNISLKYLESQKTAINLLKNIIKSNKIDCDFEQSSSYVFASDLKQIKSLDKEINFYKNNNLKYEEVSKLPLEFPIIKGFKVDDTYVFNPVSYLLKLKDLISSKVKIYEHTKALTITNKDNYYLIKTNSSQIKTKIIISCTHYPIFTIPNLIPFKTNIEKSYLYAGVTPKNLKFNAINTGYPTKSLRFCQSNNKTYLLYVTNSHNIANNLNKENRYLEGLNDYQKYFHLKPEYVFTNQDILTIDKIPYIGKVKNNFYLATGFNTWGMTNGTLSGQIISDLITKKNNEYLSLFNPLRIPYTIPNLIFYNYNNIKSFITSKLIKNYSFYPDNVKVITEKGQKVGIYIDKEGIEHKVLNTCPHLKCSLIFNNFTKTWDCPCHGSSFDIDGNIITGPSSFNIKYDN